MRFSIILTLLLDHEESKEVPEKKKKSISASGITVSESTRAPYLRNLTFPEKTYLPWETCMWVKKQVEPAWKKDWFKIGKGVPQGYILSLGLFNFYADYTMQNPKLDE